MCFYIQKEFNQRTGRNGPHKIYGKPYIAGEDIVCYKILEKGLKSPYVDYNYRLGQVSKAVIGVYSYYNKPCKWNSPLRTEINEGLHSYSSLNQAIFRRDNSSMIRQGSIYECIIPKGAEFWENTQKEEYVSDRLIVKRRLRNV